MTTIRFDNKVANSLFYFYYFQKVKKRLEALGKSSIFKTMNKDDLENLLVALPSLSEQRAIVGVLGVVNSAVELVDKIIAKTERLKKGLMQTLLTRGIGHKEFKDTEIGRIPKDWEVVKLTNIITDIYYGITAKAVEQRTSLRMLRTTDIKDYSVN